MLLRHWWQSSHFTFHREHGGVGYFSVIEFLWFTDKHCAFSQQPLLNIVHLLSKHHPVHLPPFKCLRCVFFGSEVFVHMVGLLWWTEVSYFNIHVSVTLCSFPPDLHQVLPEEPDAGHRRPTDCPWSGIQLWGYHCCGRNGVFYGTYPCFITYACMTQATTQLGSTPHTCSPQRIKAEMWDDVRWF